MNARSDGFDIHLAPGTHANNGRARRVHGKQRLNSPLASCQGCVVGTIGIGRRLGLSDFCSRGYSDRILSMVPRFAAEGSNNRVAFDRGVRMVRHSRWSLAECEPGKRAPIPVFTWLRPVGLPLMSVTRACVVPHVSDFLPAPFRIFPSFRDLRRRPSNGRALVFRGPLRIPRRSYRMRICPTADGD